MIKGLICHDKEFEFLLQAATEDSEAGKWENHICDSQCHSAVTVECGLEGDKPGGCDTGDNGSLDLSRDTGMKRGGEMEGIPKG